MTNTKISLEWTSRRGIARLWQKVSKLAWRKVFAHWWRIRDVSEEDQPEKHHHQRVRKWEHGKKLEVL